MERFKSAGPFRAEIPAFAGMMGWEAGPPRSRGSVPGTRGALRSCAHAGDPSAPAAARHPRARSRIRVIVVAAVIYSTSVLR